MPLIILFFIALIVRLIYLDSIPAELYGDVIEHIGATNTILTDGLGHWNHWYGGDGPLHPYSAAFLSLFFGNIFWTHKLCSTVFGALSVLASAVLVSRVYAYNTVDAQLDLGTSNHAVTGLQTFLKDNQSMYQEGLVTGYYGGLTRSAVERFQSQNNLSCLLNTKAAAFDSS